ncbi:hypothetical protein RKD30_000262 [Streptomyces pristinaespiralis]
MTPCCRAAVDVARPACRLLRAAAGAAPDAAGSAAFAGPRTVPRVACPWPDAAAGRRWFRRPRPGGVVRPQPPDERLARAEPAGTAGERAPAVRLPVVTALCRTAVDIVRPCAAPLPPAARRPRAGAERCGRRPLLGSGLRGCGAWRQHGPAGPAARERCGRRPVGRGLQLPAVAERPATPTALPRARARRPRARAGAERCGRRPLLGSGLRGPGAWRQHGPAGPAARERCGRRPVGRGLRLPAGAERPATPTALPRGRA